MSLNLKKSPVKGKIKLFSDNKEFIKRKLANLRVIYIDLDETLLNDRSKLL